METMTNEIGLTTPRREALSRARSHSSTEPQLLGGAHILEWLASFMGYFLETDKVTPQASYLHAPNKVNTRPFKAHAASPSAVTWPLVNNLRVIILGIKFGRESLEEGRIVNILTHIIARLELQPGTARVPAIPKDRSNCGCSAVHAQQYIGSERRAGFPARNCHEMATHPHLLWGAVSRV